MPDTLLNDEWLGMIVPGFQYRNDIKYCTPFKDCVEGYFSLFDSNTIIRILPLLPSTKSELRQCMIEKNCTTFRPETRTHVSIHLFNCLYSYRLITMLNGLMSQLQRLFISSIIQIAFLWNRISSYISTIDLDIL